jgi:hypothetical protein
MIGHNWKPSAPPTYIEFADICSNCGCIKLHGCARFDGIDAYWKSIEDWMAGWPKNYDLNEEPNCIEEQIRKFIE